MIWRDLGLISYLSSYAGMQRFCAARDAHTEDEIWLCQHFPVYTQGRRGGEAPSTANIPTIATNRGGLITYHGPGQQMAYLLLDIRRLNMGPRRLVTQIEAALIETLATFGIIADRRDNAPGVYVDEAKIAALGLRISQGFTYHGLSLNVNMDLTPFTAIDPCGYADLSVTQVSDLMPHATMQEVVEQLRLQLAAHLVG